MAKIEVLAVVLLWIGRPARIDIIRVESQIKVTYAVLLLYYVLKNPATSSKDRAKIIGALGYFILPIDLIPDFIPVAGYTDDLAALTWGIYCVIKSITPEVKANAAAKLHEWFGDFDDHLLDLFFEKKGE